MSWFNIIKRSPAPSFARPKGETVTYRDPRHSGYRSRKELRDSGYRRMGHFEREGLKNLKRQNRERHLANTGKKSTTDMLDYQFRDLTEDDERAEKDALESNVQAQPSGQSMSAAPPESTMGNFTNYPEQALPLEQRVSAFDPNPQVEPWATE